MYVHYQLDGRQTPGKPATNGRREQKRDTNGAGRKQEIRFRCCLLNGIDIGVHCVKDLLLVGIIQTPCLTISEPPIHYQDDAVLSSGGVVTVDSARNRKCGLLLINWLDDLS